MNNTLHLSPKIISTAITVYRSHLRKYSSPPIHLFRRTNWVPDCWHNWWHGWDSQSVVLTCNTGCFITCWLKSMKKSMMDGATLKTDCTPGLHVVIKCLYRCLSKSKATPPFTHTHKEILPPSWLIILAHMLLPSSCFYPSSSPSSVFSFIQSLSVVTTSSKVGAKAKGLYFACK